MNSLDLGCGVGPGSDSEDVFFVSTIEVSGLLYEAGSCSKVGS